MVFQQLQLVFSFRSTEVLKILEELCHSEKIFVFVGNEAYHTRTVTHYKSYGMHVKYVKSLLENESLNCLKSFVCFSSLSTFIYVHVEHQGDNLDQRGKQF